MLLSRSCCIRTSGAHTLLLLIIYLPANGHGFSEKEEEKVPVGSSNSQTWKVPWLAEEVGEHELAEEVGEHELTLGWNPSGTSLPVSVSRSHSGKACLRLKHCRL
jgi:hypothetical protein